MPARAARKVRAVRKRAAARDAGLSGVRAGIGPGAVIEAEDRVRPLFDVPREIEEAQTGRTEAADGRRPADAGLARVRPRRIERVAPRELAPVAGARRLLPLALVGQPVDPRRAHREPA